jgi:hypothetical protein
MVIIVNFKPEDRAWLDDHFKASPRPMELREPPRWATFLFQVACWTLLVAFTVILLAGLKALVEQTIHG